MRLIDADALKKAIIKHLCVKSENNLLPAEKSIYNCIDEQPTVEQSKKQQPKWIPVSEGMPEERETIFAKLKGTDKWRSAMFEKMSDDVRIVVVFPDGTCRVSHSHTVDGKWECEKSPVKRTVTHWMPNPELPLEGR